MLTHFVRGCLFTSIALPLTAATLTTESGTIGTGPNIVIKSPDGKLAVLVGIGAEERLSYAIRDGSDIVLPPSALGLVVDEIDLGKSAKISGPGTCRDIRETYPLLGNHTVAENHATEAVIPIETAGKKFNLIVRAQNDGVAVRYSLPEGAVTINGDSTSWTLPETTGKIIWADLSDCYEGQTHSTSRLSCISAISTSSTWVHPSRIFSGNSLPSGMKPGCCPAPMLGKWSPSPAAREIPGGWA